MLEILNQHIIKILVAIRKGDSIRQISKRINLSYGWTYYWCGQLEKKGVLKKEGKKIFLVENDFYKEVIKFISVIIKKDLALHYSIISLFGLKYAFCFTDAVFVWTKGGYNIARSKENYPIFIKICEDNLPFWKFYFEKLSLPYTYIPNLRKKGIYYVLDVVKEDFFVDSVDNIPVIPLQECIDFMRKYIYNFEPAIEMIQEMYDKELGVRYRHR